MTDPNTQPSTEELKLHIQQELVASGNYRDIYNFLKIQLANSGWIEQFSLLAADTINSTESSDLKFGNLVDRLQDKGLQMVPDDVKLETLKKIREFLDDVIK